jgi:predicted ABC-type ATPase
LPKSVTPRLRIFAGPNGSGKTSLVRNFPKAIKLGVLVNADDIEKELNQTNELALKPYGISINAKSLLHHFAKGICATKGISLKLENIDIKKHKLVIKNLVINSYIAADIAEFIRLKLLSSGKSFSFETVFSHQSKLEFIKLAKANRYRIYLYFIATESADINISRVENRVAKSGHHVDAKIISSRYGRTLDNLFDAVKLSNRAYVFDNSGEYAELICEVTDGRKVVMRDIDKQIPEWFKNYFYTKAIKTKV